MELIYNALEPDVAAYLKANKPRPKHKQNYYHWFTQDYGLQQVITHIYKFILVAKTCKNIQLLRECYSRLSTAGDWWETKQSLESTK